MTRWAVQEGFAASDPLSTLRPLNARTDPRRERRALSWDDELPRLVRAASTGPEYRGVYGPLRALVYRFAAETGLRVGELTLLRVGDFDLAGERPSVTVRAATAMNRREVTLPLLPETARKLSAFLRERMPQAPAFPLPRSFRDKATRWLRFDLAAAEIPYQDECGRFADFHALRAAFVSGLIRSGANARVVQSLARDSSSEMTLAAYAKLSRDDERDALALLPELPTCTLTDPEEKRATGTEGASKNVASSVAFGPASSCTSVHPDAALTPTHGNETAPEEQRIGGGGGSRTRVPSEHKIDATRDAGDSSQDSPAQAGGKRGVPCGVPVSFPPTEGDSDLARLLAAWPELSSAVRRSLADLALGSATAQGRST